MVLEPDPGTLGLNPWHGTPVIHSSYSIVNSLDILYEANGCPPAFFTLLNVIYLCLVFTDVFLRAATLNIVVAAPPGKLVRIY